MSKREFNLRHNAIIIKLKRPATFKQIYEYLEEQSELTEYNLTVSVRTFLRDIIDIRSTYGIEILCNKAKNEYYINYDNAELHNNRLLDAFNTVNALNSTMGFANYLQFEDYAAKGTENFNGILHAIKNQLQLKTSYQTYHTEAATPRNIHPYLLKEFKNRWYVIAKDVGKNKIRNFALDRFKDLEITKIRFSYPNKSIAENYYKDSFGIIAHNEDDQLVTTILKFESLQGKYILSLPLHKSQQIITNNEEGLVISLRVYHTFDFIKELLSHGEKLKVLEPKSLIETMKAQLSRTLKQYD